MADWQRCIERAWYQGSPWLVPLWPLGWLVGWVASGRLRRFRRLAAKPPVPVLVVGNVTVGGTGKTPLVIALACRARERSLNVVVISRGYGGKTGGHPMVVAADDDAGRVGDEPLLIARRTGVPVIVDPQRARALDKAIADFQPDLVISDDGLQHYALPRSAEVAVIDGRRGLGNGRCLPAGPLREPARRLGLVDFVVANGGHWPGAVALRLLPDELVRLSDGTRLDTATFARRHGSVHGVAGIGNPQRFFATLAELGLTVTAHAFPDHHVFRENELDFADVRPVIMTEKDAVKCRAFSNTNLWALPVRASLPDGAVDRMIDRALAGHAHS